MHCGSGVESAEVSEVEGSHPRLGRPAPGQGLWTWDRLELKLSAPHIVPLLMGLKVTAYKIPQGPEAPHLW